MFLNVWEVIGPFSNYIIYLGVAIYYAVSNGCDVIPGHTIGLYRNEDTRNIYYEAEGKWKKAIKAMVRLISLVKIFDIF